MNIARNVKKAIILGNVLYVKDICYIFAASYVGFRYYEIVYEVEKSLSQPLFFFAFKVKNTFSLGY